MFRQHTLSALLLGILVVTGCARDAKNERTTVSAVTNEEMTGDEQEPGKTRMQYAEVDREEALNRDGTSTLAEGSAESADCQRAVFFETDSAKLDDSAEQNLAHVAECMKRHEVDHAIIVGRTDASGSASHNQQLGMERARTVAEYLRKLGVPEEDIRIRSKGEVASAESEQLWPSERRTSVGVQ